MKTKRGEKLTESQDWGIKTRENRREDGKRERGYEKRLQKRGKVYDRRKNKSNIKKAGKMWRAKPKVRR